MLRLGEGWLSHTPQHQHVAMFFSPGVLFNSNQSGLLGLGEAKVCALSSALLVLSVHLRCMQNQGCLAILWSTYLLHSAADAHGIHNLTAVNPAVLMDTPCSSKTLIGLITYHDVQLFS